MIIEFYSSPTCGPCKTMVNVMKRFQDKNPNVTVKKIDVTEEVELATTKKIIAVPTFITYVDNVEIDRKVGVAQMNYFEELLPK